LKLFIVDDSEEEELDIIWELDPKGSSSPPPSPPRKHYKVGAAFPVPPRARSPLSATAVSRVSRDPVNAMNYRHGDYTTTAPNSTRGLFVSADNFQGFGINPCGGTISESFLNGRMF
jgi:hypothetical protein